MAGNVWEWCNSWYDDRKSGRVLRGGSWYNDFFENNCRGAIRNDFYPDDNWYNGGFRCVALSPGP